MRTFIQVTFFLIFLIFSCDNSVSSTNGKKNITIDIQPFSNMNGEDIKYVYNQLKERYAFIELKDPIPLPGFAFYPERHRYRADTLIHYLARQTQEGHVTLGLTNNDISTTKETKPDWGVMGLGYQPGKSCIASSFRLSKTERHMQLFKVAIHELGHTQGLTHCAIKTCFMRDAESRNPTNEEIDFCTSCKSKLKDKGLPL